MNFAVQNLTPIVPVEQEKDSNKKLTLTSDMKHLVMSFLSEAEVRQVCLVSREWFIAGTNHCYLSISARLPSAVIRAVKQEVSKILLKNQGLQGKHNVFINTAEYAPKSVHGVISNNGQIRGGKWPIREPIAGHYALQIKEKQNEGIEIILIDASRCDSDISQADLEIREKISKQVQYGNPTLSGIATLLKACMGNVYEHNCKVHVAHKGFDVCHLKVLDSFSMKILKLTTQILKKSIPS